MAENLKGKNAIEILRQPEIYKCFTDADNPVSIKVIYRLSDWFFNREDIWKIESAKKQNGPIKAAAELFECLVKRYKDKPDVLTLADFIEALENQKTNYKLVEMLYSKTKNRNIPHSVSKSDAAVITDIKSRLRFTCENVAKVWRRFLNETKLEKCFVEPEIVEEEIGEDGKKRRKETGKVVATYAQLFQSECFGDRIVIEGDPGMGKTTYVNKLALDWTLDDGPSSCSDNRRFLESTFIIVFLIPLRSLNGGKSSTLVQAADIQLTNCGSWLHNQFLSFPSRCLLILDAFDEYDWSCPEINEIIEAKLFPSLKVIITTRPSDIRRLEIRNQWLSITGLTKPETRQRFLIYQGWDKLEEREMIVQVLSGLGTLWHTPLYLAMLCVLYKAKEATNFNPQHPNCFHILVKLFTEHIMSRCENEKMLKMKGDKRLKLKSYVQQLACQQFADNNPWFKEIMKDNHLELDIHSDYTLSDVVNLAKLAGEVGLVIIQEEQSSVTGQNIETLSFIHKMFLEYYAAVRFCPMFNNCCNKDNVVQRIEANENLSFSSFSYFLAAESNSYKQLLVNGQKDKCKFNPIRQSFTINVDAFPWIPEIEISGCFFKELPNDVLKRLQFYCDLTSTKSFWDIDYIKEFCATARPTSLVINRALFSFHASTIDNILSSVEELTLHDCDCENVNLPQGKVYPHIRKYIWRKDTSPKIEEMELLKCFPKLHTLHLCTPITGHTIKPLCDSVRNMNQLVQLKLSKCFTSPQSVSHVVQLAETIEIASSITLKELRLYENILDTETESSAKLVFKAISKCVQLQKLRLIRCQINPKSLIIIKDILQNSANLKKNLNYLLLTPKNWDEFVEPEQRIQTTITDNDLAEWQSEVNLILPQCKTYVSDRFTSIDLNSI